MRRCQMVNEQLSSSQILILIDQSMQDNGANCVFFQNKGRIFNTGKKIGYWVLGVGCWVLGIRYWVLEHQVKQPFS